jgi:hypothetical protein
MSYFELAIQLRVVFFNAAIATIIPQFEPTRKGGPPQAEQSGLKVGQRVEMVTRKLRDAARGEEGLIVYGYKFRPVANGS